MAEPKIEIVAETPVEPTEAPVEEQKTSRFQNFNLNHPRTAKVVGVIALTAATLGAVQVWKNRAEKKAALEAEEADTSDDSFDTSSEIVA